MKEIFADKYTWPKLRAIDEVFTEVGVLSTECIQRRLSEQWTL
jgi:hypothetical protein